MALAPDRRHPLMAITQSGGPLPQPEQAARLCAAGIRWIQMRMKDAPADIWLATAREVAAICRRHGTLCIINDSVDIALEVGADGAHLGRTDLDWREARKRLGPDRILGGTVNYLHEAEKAARAGCLDYVGVGPVRFTRTKKELAPLQGFEGIRALIGRLDGIPAWAIGGLESADAAAVRAAGAAGMAVCTAFLRNGEEGANVAAFAAAWAEAERAGPPRLEPLSR